MRRQWVYQKNVGELKMSTNKVIGSGAAAVATLPVTGSPTLTVALLGAALVVGGLLLFRAGRIRRSA